MTTTLARKRSTFPNLADTFQRRLFVPPPPFRPSIRRVALRLYLSIHPVSYLLTRPPSYPALQLLSYRTRTHTTSHFSDYRIGREPIFSLFTDVEQNDAIPHHHRIVVWVLNWRKECVCLELRIRVRGVIGTHGLRGGCTGGEGKTARALDGKGEGPRAWKTRGRKDMRKVQ